MKIVASILLLIASLAAVRAEIAQPDPLLTTRSISGQFFVRATAVHTDARVADRLLAGGGCVQLDPSLLVVSTERIKQILWRKLGDKPSFRGRIYVDLRPAISGNDGVRIAAERFADGWRYRVSLPEIIERKKFVRAITQSLLLEIANRGATERCVELPVWLVEGFSQEVNVSGEMAGELKIFLPPPSEKEAGMTITRVKLDERRTNSLHWARIVLGERAPLTFEQLSWPADDQLATEASEVYQSSAQLFVVRLLELNDGPAGMRAMLRELSKHLNWQIAFLNAFKAHFENLLDVEKWWAVQISNFTGRDIEHTWSHAESWRKLDAALRASVEVSTGTNAAPLRTEVTLQSLLRSGNGIENAKFFRQKLDALDSLRLRSSPDVVGLVDEYRGAIGAFLEKEKITNPFLRVRKFHELVVNRAAQDLIRRLDALEVTREALRPVPPVPDAKEPENISAAFR